MPEVRIDPLTGQKTIVAADRATRPGGGLSAVAPDPIDPESDPFLEGHEDRTPPETFAVRPNGGAPDGPGWRVRVVPNLYPALAPDSPAPEATVNADLFAASPARGAHEVVINAPAPCTRCRSSRSARSPRPSMSGGRGCARTQRRAPPTCT